MVYTSRVSGAWLLKSGMTGSKGEYMGSSRTWGRSSSTSEIVDGVVYADEQAQNAVEEKADHAVSTSA